MSATIGEHALRFDFIKAIQEHLGEEFRVVNEIILPAHVPDVVVFDAATSQIDEEEERIEWDREIPPWAVIETKRRNESAGAGLAQAMKYANLIGSQLLFTTNFREVEGATRKPFRPIWKGKTKRRKTTSDTAKIIAITIRDFKNNPKTGDPPTFEDIVKVLNGVIEYIDEGIRRTASSEITKDLEQELGTFFAYEIKKAFQVTPTQFERAKRSKKRRRKKTTSLDSFVEGKTVEEA
ncbi:MAG: hypothetical protein ACE5I5_12610 [Candidatus Heimdallarchaeota archaeon]